MSTPPASIACFLVAAFQDGQGGQAKKMAALAILLQIFRN